MGLLTIPKRFLFYGGITALIACPIAYKLGQVSAMDKQADHQYVIRNPDDTHKYVVNFENKTINLYAKKAPKKLEEKVQPDEINSNQQNKLDELFGQ